MQEPKLLKALLTNIAKLETENKLLRQKIRRQNQRISEIYVSRTSWKDKYKAEKALKVLTRNSVFGSTTKAKGYSYTTQLISLSVGLYLLGGCSYRSVVRILLYFNLEWGINIAIPSKSSISIWVEKLGYYQYAVSAEIYKCDYGLIIDECMVIGQQRLLLILGINATKTENRASLLSDVRLLGIEVRASWKAEDVAKSIAKVTEKMQRQPVYVISDGAANLKKGIADAGLIRLSDVSHKMALILEKHYKNTPLFMAWSKDLSKAKFVGIMQAQAYLLPPKQRTIARFMNLSASIDWSKKMLLSWENLSVKEQLHFQWISNYKSFIDEISTVFDLSNQIITELKIKGLSHKSVDNCLKLIEKFPKKVADMLLPNIKAYLLEEKDKLADENTVWHTCSNVIESVFGKYKSNLSSNPLNGVTGMVLSLALQTNKGLKFNLNNALEQVSMAELNTWKCTHLSDNQVVKRKNTLKI